jgi:hypothetical protein
MNTTIQLREIAVAVGDIFNVNPLLAALWWLTAVALAAGLVYTWQRLLNS